MPAHGPLIAAIQMCSGADVAANLEQARHLVEAAVARGAGLVALPENFSFMGMDERAKLEVQEREGAGPIQEFLAHTARQHRIWLVAGSVPLQASVADKVRASCLVYDDGGQLKARYDKIHLFGFEMGEERYFEARTIEPGDAIVVVDSPFGRLGLSICYDLRFPELYRAMQGIDIVLVPSAFTETTGSAHWETLLRARAIENLVYVLAPAQGGLHANGRRTYGDSMIIDPWGTILDRVASGCGAAVAPIDARHMAKLRASLPALSHRTIRSC
jgi:nitrilase